ncbi:BnaC05g00360D [Brassica napus]|uniref:BnaC05g00360D protein n=1 Tax=Brassica napus TaxID=3708 RepID=A0A078FQN1_BRANA|nr:BnaC05g00360D [Brassica napus]
MPYPILIKQRIVSAQDSVKDFFFPSSKHK